MTTIKSTGGATGDGFVSMETVAARHGGEDDASAEATKHAADDEVVRDSPGFLEELVDDARACADEGAALVEEAFEAVDEGLDEVAVHARSIDEKLAAAESGVRSLLDDASGWEGPEPGGPLLVPEVTTEAVESVADTVVEMPKTFERLEAADDALAQAAGEAVARHLGDGVGEFVRVSLDEKSLLEGAAAAVVGRHLSNPAEIGRLLENPVVDAALEVTLDVAEIIAPRANAAVQTDAARVGLHVLAAPILGPAAPLVVETVVLPGLASMAAGAEQATAQAEDFRTAALALSEKNLERKVQSLKAGEKAVMSLGGSLSAHDGVGGGVHAGTTLEIEACPDGTWTVGVASRRSGEAGIGVEGQGIGAAADLVAGGGAGCVYRCSTRDDVLALLGLASSESMDTIAGSREGISFARRSTTRELGFSGDALLGLDAKTRLVAGTADIDGDGRCDEPFVEVVNTLSLGAGLTHINTGDAFSPRELDGLEPLFEPGNGWLGPDAVHAIGGLLKPEHGELGWSGEVAAEISVKASGPSSLDEIDDDVTLEYGFKAQLRSGNDTVEVTAKVHLKEPARLAAALGKTPSQFALALREGAVTPKELSALARRAGVAEAVRVEAAVELVQATGVSVDAGGLSARDQVERKHMVWATPPVRRELNPVELSGRVTV